MNKLIFCLLILLSCSQEPRYKLNEVQDEAGNTVYQVQQRGETIKEFTNKQRALAYFDSLNNVTKDSL